MSRETKETKVKFRKKRGKPCHFCENKLNTVDYKNIDLLVRFVSGRGKIQPRRQSFLCAKHQRKVSEAIKRARLMGLLPFVAE